MKIIKVKIKKKFYSVMNLNDNSSEETLIKVIDFVNKSNKKNLSKTFLVENHFINILLYY